MERLFLGDEVRFEEKTLYVRRAVSETLVDLSTLPYGGKVIYNVDASSASFIFIKHGNGYRHHQGLPLGVFKNFDEQLGFCREMGLLRGLPGPDSGKIADWSLEEAMAALREDRIDAFFLDPTKPGRRGNAYKLRNIKEEVRNERLAGTLRAGCLRFYEEHEFSS